MEMEKTACDWASDMFCRARDVLVADPHNRECVKKHIRQYGEHWCLDPSTQKLRQSAQHFRNQLQNWVLAPNSISLSETAMHTIMSSPENPEAFRFRASLVDLYDYAIQNPSSTTDYLV